MRETSNKEIIIRIPVRKAQKIHLRNNGVCMKSVDEFGERIVRIDEEIFPEIIIPSRKVTEITTPSASLPDNE
ncbi:hypothetical protein JZK55_21720 [Dissulfurispira thermophila]|uniref:Uncharacterized protein n=2 Tax=root TaxID=1 RepID=A0A7G1H369_9BACT|nr:hypothetical protein JZK55_21720 [Dissulfurispira thermophila]